MGLWDQLKSAGGDALHAGADTAYDTIAKQAGIGTGANPAPTPGATAGNTPSPAGASPVSDSALHFSPSGIIAYVKANPLKGIALVLTVGGLALWAVRKFRK